jgi:trans-aconitate methyltransferase
MGCGAGFLVKFLLDRLPGTKVQGIDTAKNLVRIGTALCGRPLIVGNYLNTEPDDAYELIICNFGFDLPNFTASRVHAQVARASI